MGEPFAEPAPKSKRQLELEAQGYESVLVEGLMPETEAERDKRMKAFKAQETYSYMMVTRKER